jgi:hypothetical protein
MRCSRVMRCTRVTISGCRTVGSETVATAFGGSRRAETASDGRKEGHALQPRDDFGMSHGRTGNGGNRFWWKSEGRNSVG